MFIAFGWGENPATKDMKYEVSDYSLEIFNAGSDRKLANCLPGTIRMSIHVPVSKDPGKEFLEYASNQLEAVKKKGAGKISVFAGRDVGEALQEVSFTSGWVTSFSFRSSVSNEEFLFDVTIAAGSVAVSGVTFLHPERMATIPK